MNENIGAKGTGKDHIRSMIILKKRKEKIQKDYRERKLKEKEKILKRQQIENIIKVVPIAILGETLRIITSKEQKKEEQNLEIKSSNLTPKKLIINEKVKMIIESKTEIKQVVQNQIEIKKDILTKQKENKETKLQLENEKKQEENKKKEDSNQKEQQPVNKKQINNNILPTIMPIAIAPLCILNIRNYQTKQQEINRKKEYIGRMIAGNNNDIELKKVQSIKIIENYEKRLKDIRYELRGLIYEYNIIHEQISKTYREEDIDKLIERLNLIITKLEQLKSKIQVDNLNKYDDNYLYNLVEEYIKNFDDNQIIDEIKDSDLYILLSSKIGELDTEKDKMSKKLTNKKDRLHISEEKLIKLKEEYFNIEKFNETLEKFQQDQEKTIMKIQEKIQTSDKITEQIEAKVIGMTKESQRLLEILAIQMMMPGINNAKAMATTTMLYLLFMKKAMKPKIAIEKHKVIKVTDYSKDIENNLKNIDNVSEMLDKTSNKLDEMIEKFKFEYKDLLGEIPECNQLLSNLEKVKSNLKEKEYEIEKIKEAQKQNLVKNYNKIKTLNNKKVV